MDDRDAHEADEKRFSCAGVSHCLPSGLCDSVSQGWWEFDSHVRGGALRRGEQGVHSIRGTRGGTQAGPARNRRRPAVTGAVVEVGNIWRVSTVVGLNCGGTRRRRLS